jgi:hypothetical protein
VNRPIKKTTTPQAMIPAMILLVNFGTFIGLCLRTVEVSDGGGQALAISQNSSARRHSLH